MKKIKVTMIRFWTPGSLCAECINKEVDYFDKSKIEWPENAYAFTVHERYDVIDDETYKGKEKQIGPRYYHPDSKVETLNQVKMNKNSTQILIDNMKFNGWGKIIWSRWGNWPQPFNENESVIFNG